MWTGGSTIKENDRPVPTTLPLPPQPGGEDIFRSRLRVVYYGKVRLTLPLTPTYRPPPDDEGVGDLWKQESRGSVPVRVSGGDEGI